MSFLDRLKHLDSKLLMPLFIGSLLIVTIQGLSKTLTNGSDDYQRILVQLLIFTISLTISSFAKFYFFYALGKRNKLIKHQSFSNFTSSLLSEWIVVEVRIQLRTLFRLLLFIIPGVIESLRLSLAPVYVFFSDKMEQPEFDPVLESKNNLNFSESKKLFILFLINLITIGLSFAFMDGSFFNDTKDFVKAFLSVFVTTATAYFYYTYITHLYLDFNKSEK